MLLNKPCPDAIFRIGVLLSDKSGIFNDSLVLNENLKNYFKNIFETQSNYFFDYRVYDPMTFETFFKIHTSSKLAIHEVWQNYSEELFDKSYHNLYSEERKIIYEKYPYGIFENILETN